MKNVRVRFAPSPTGHLHIGGARTALFNYLYARQHQGSFVLRIEDTDLERSKPEYDRGIVEGLRWLGLDWDEGPDKGGKYGPYRQTERVEFYRLALSDLHRRKAIYPCYCTPEELTQERTEQRARGQPPLYSGKCRQASDQQRSAWEREGRPPIYRFAVQPGELVINDLIRGNVVFDTASLGDFSVARSLTTPLYNLAVVIDDAHMKITHVIRGEDHLSNTPKQILIFQSLGIEPPEYAHLPLLLGPNRTKLSKRDAVTSVLDFQQEGFLPEALLNFLALLGWNPKDDREEFTLDELMKAFHLQHVQKAGAIVDRKKLEYLNGRYLRRLPVEEIIKRAGERLAQLRQSLGDRLPQAVALIHDRVTTLNEIPVNLAFVTKLPAYESSLLVPEKGSQERTKTVLTNLRTFWEQGLDQEGNASQKETALRAWMKQQGYAAKETLWPLRVALSGQQHSPGVFDIAALLTPQEIIRRLDIALQKAS